MADRTPSSTDDARAATPLRHARSHTLDAPLPLALGGELPDVEVAYETWGTLDADGQNAVLICHALSGDSHAAPHDADDDPGWWEDLIGPGKPIDTDRYFVICSNVLGGCRGTTGPGSINPATGRAWGPDFPDITVGDMVEVQRRLLGGLGVARLLAVVGGSLGGHQALQWAVAHPRQVGLCAAIATSPRLSAQALAFDVIARNAIRHDPRFHAGRYDEHAAGPDVGLAIARMLGHITYLSPVSMADKFDPDRLRPRDIETAFEKRFSVGSYLAHQGHKFVDRFDANSYLSLSTAMDLFDLGRTPADLAATLARAVDDWLVVSYSSDWLFPTAQSRRIVDALCRLGRSVTYTEVATDAGHDAFLLPDVIARYGPLLRAKLDRAHDAARGRAGRAFTRRYRDEEVHQQNPTSIFHQRRLDYDTMLGLIEPHESVLDLGAGRGGLLARLAAKRVEATKARGPQSLGFYAGLVGVEVNHDNLIATAERGFDVIDVDLNAGLPMFAEGQFDVVVLSQTLQAVEDVQRVLSEMVRVGRRGIVSFPNFGHHELREMLAAEGRSPKAAGGYPYEWYDTPNRRFPSILDFEDLCAAKGYTILDAVYLDTAHDRTIAPDADPNRHADTAVFVISG